MTKGNFISFVLLLFSAALVFSGCASRSTEKTTEQSGSVYYHGPEINAPILVPTEEVHEQQEDEEDGNDDPDIDDGVDYYSILRWLPFKDNFLWDLPFEPEPEPEEEDLAETEGLYDDPSTEEEGYTDNEDLFELPNAGDRFSL